MKTRLLKKVRERYDIVRIDKLDTHPNEIMSLMRDSLGLPFYMVADKESFQGMRTKFIKDFSKAQELVIKWTIKDYRHKFKSQRGKREKVWWVNK